MPYSFLHIAAMRNDCVKAQQLIDGEAPDDVHVWKSMPLEMRGRNFDPIFVDERDSNGWTPLMVAATHGHLDMCRLLVEREANIAAKKNFKCSALHLAAHGGHTRIVELLVQCKADVMAQKLDNSTALHDAAKGGHIDVAKLLLSEMHTHLLKKRDAILTLTDDHRRTALHLASRRGHPEMVRWLVANGASITSKDEDGKTAIDLAMNRRTLVAFPGHIDPVDVSVQQVGVMALELDEMKHLKLDENGKIVEPSSAAKRIRSRKGDGRPTTSDVGNFTSTLGILHDDIGKDNFARVISTHP